MFMVRKYMSYISTMGTLYIYIYLYILHYIYMHYLPILRIGFVYTWVTSIWEAARWKMIRLFCRLDLGCGFKDVMILP